MDFLQAVRNSLPGAKTRRKIGVTASCDVFISAALAVETRARGKRCFSAAFRELQRAWAQFAGVDKKNCLAAATIGGLVSYVGLLACLETARDVNVDNDRRGSQTTDAMRLRAPGVTVGVRRDPITPGQVPGNG